MRATADPRSQTDARPALRPSRRAGWAGWLADWQGHRNYGVVLCSSVHGPGTALVGDIQGIFCCIRNPSCNPASPIRSAYVSCLLADDIWVLTTKYAT